MNSAAPDGVGAQREEPAGQHGRGAKSGAGSRWDLPLRWIRFLSLIALGLLVGGLTLTSYLSQRRLSHEIDRDRERPVQQTRLIRWKMEAHLDRMEQELQRLARLGEVKEALAKRDRAELLEQVRPPLNRLRKSPMRVEQINVYLPSGTVFLRAHEPGAYGDDAQARRPLVAEAARTRRIVRGLEPDANTLFIWVAMPLYEEGRFMGILELGTPLASLLEELKDHLAAAGVGLFATKQRGAGGVVLSEATDRGLLAGLEPSLDVSRELETPHGKVVTARGRTFAATLIPAKDFAPLGEGTLAIISDVTAFTQLVRRNTTSFIAISVIGFLLAAIVIFALTNRLEGAYRAALLGKAEVLEALSELSQMLTAARSADEVLRHIVGLAAHLAASAAVRLWLVDGTSGEMYIAAAAGSIADPQGGSTRLKITHSLIGQIVKERQAYFTSDLFGDPRWQNAAWAKTHSLSSFAGIPLTVADNVLGVLSVFRETPRGFTPEERNLLSALAHEAAITLENTRLYTEVRNYSQDLERKVAERTAELEHANRAKSEFLANMSHELRTPLNAIIGFSQMLQMPTFGSLTPKQQKYLTNIQTSGVHLLNLVNDVLDLARVEAGRLELHREAVALSAALAQALDGIRPQAEKKALKVDYAVEPGLPPVHADPVRLRQILTNLLSNAVKFTPEGGRVTVRAARGTAGQPPEEGVEIQVEDTGIGIAPEDLGRLFRKFEQLDAGLSKGHQGTGLGLALTQHLVELHGGSIAVHSAGRGRGSTFTVRLPVAPRRERPLVLAVEDDPGMRELLACSLREWGWEAATAATLAEARAALDRERPDLVILDAALPDGSGTDFVRELRQGPASRVPLLLFTGLGAAEGQAALRAGADDYLVKPAPGEAIYRKASKLLGRSGWPGLSGAAGQSEAEGTGAVADLPSPPTQGARG